MGAALVVTTLFAIHGMIHLLGLLKWSKLALVPQLSGQTLVPLSAGGERIFAASWLAALLLLVGAAALRLAEREVWWAPALLGIAVSQGLIIMTWQDARFGTILNVLLLVPALAAGAHASFLRNIDREVDAILRDSSPLLGQGLVRPSALEELPTPVRHWLETSGVVGRAPIRTVHLRQRGELRTAPDARWMPMAAEQWFTVDPPAFIWRVDATMFGVLPVAGRDRFVGGHGEMRIKAGSLVSVVDAADEKIDQGALLRFLGEMVWFPSAALQPYVTWQAIDGDRARATIHQGDTVASAVFSFGEDGRMRGLQAERYLGAGEGAKLTPWVVTCSAWRSFQGIEVPSRGEVSWTLASGPFSYFRWELLDLGFDQEALSAEPTASRPLVVRVSASEPAGARESKQ